MDTIRLVISELNCDDLRGGADEVLILVNGNNLYNKLDGMMLGPPPEVVFYPSRHLLDRPHPWFSDEGKVILYTCPGCGIDGCDRMLVKITLDGDRVIWSDFDHQIACKSIEPNIDPSIRFVFDRRQYEKELSQEYVVKNDVYFEYMNK